MVGAFDGNHRSGRRVSALASAVLLLLSACAGNAGDATSPTATGASGATTTVDAGSHQKDGLAENGDGAGVTTGVGATNDSGAGADSPGEEEGVASSKTPAEATTSTTTDEDTTTNQRPIEPLPVPCWVSEAGDASIASARVSDAPADLANVLARVSHNASFVYGDLAYEGNNADVRGEPDSDGMYDVSGATIAARWRDMAGQVERLFVLRDSLWSQQDHPYRHADPCALVIPPNWITAAVAVESPRRVTAPAVDDDGAWLALSADQADVFGTFPPSEALHEVATRTPATDAERTATTNARETLQSMANLAGRLLAERLTGGPEEALRLGADLLARGDIEYFGEDLRRSTVIPILVPNVGPKEIEEGKGFAVPGVAIADSVLRDIEHAVFDRRLLDGDIALERYDLTKPVDRALAIAMLERLIPEDGPEGATVWLWINGRLDPDLKLRGEDPTAYIADFRDELNEADIDLDRLDFVSKPVVDVSSRTGLGVEAARYARLGLPLSITLNPSEIAGLDG